MVLQLKNINVQSVRLYDQNRPTTDSSASMGLLMQHEDHSDEWVHIQQPDPLKVIIVGGGIGGLTAALALRQQGHDVQVYESSGFSKEVGAALHVAPNANGILKRLGISCSDIGANKCAIMSEYLSTGVKVKQHDLLAATKIYEHSWRLAHRVKLHDALRKSATGAAGVGKPATLHLASPVEDVDTQNAIVYFRDGTSVQGDVVIGADGVHSVTRKKLPGGDVQPTTSGLSAFRFLIPRETVLADPRTRKFAEVDGNMHGFFGPDRSVIMYPTCDDTLLNFCCIHPESASMSSEGWGSNSRMSDLLEVYGSFDSDILALLQMADESSLKVWKLLDMKELPTWCDGRFALLGDAAHPFLPFLGQGGAIAMEDAVSLGVVLEAGLSKDDVPKRLELYQDIRKARATLVQHYTRLSGKKRGEKGSFDIAKYQNYCFAHDEFNNSSQKLREWKWAQENTPSSPMTTVFGPPVASRQNHAPSTQSTFTTASIKFHTSQTVVQTLLPPGDQSYRFKSPGTIAQCTFSQTSLRGLPWLGGKGYNQLGLYIHGVEHTDARGRATIGAFLPIMFENMADVGNAKSIEHIDVPSAWSTIEVERDRKSYHVRTGWEGLTWGNFCLDELEPASTTSPPVTATATSTLADSSQDDEGTFIHQYSPERMRTEQAVFVPHKMEGEEAKPIAHRVWKAREAHLNLNARDWESLPTLHHIISRLQEIPVLDVIEAKVVEGRGIPEFA